MLRELPGKQSGLAALLRRRWEEDARERASENVLRETVEAEPGCLLYPMSPNLRQEHLRVASKLRSAAALANAA